MSMKYWNVKPTITEDEFKLFEQIAKEALSIDTLKDRGNDSLDFHDCGVCGIEMALKTAYEAGKEASKK